MQRKIELISAARHGKEKKISHSKQDFAVWYGMVYMARARAREAPLSQVRYLGRACKRVEKGWKRGIWEESNVPLDSFHFSFILITDPS